MYCPKCSQPGAGDNARFCPQCGFRLDKVMELLANDGGPAWGGEAVPARVYPPGRFTQPGVRLGAKLMFISAVMLPIFFALGIMLDTPGPLIVPVTLFFAGLARLIYAKIFTESLATAQSTQATFDRPIAPLSYLAPIGDQFPVRNDLRRVDTAEISPPGSVSEHTTKFLKNNG